MDLGMQDNVVIVTAAGGGIGSAVCEALLSEGAHVVAAGRGAASVDGATAVECDLLDQTAASEIVRRARRAFGRLDAVVAVLGGPEPSTQSFSARDDDRWQRAFEFNLLSSIRLIRESLPYLVESPVASIVHIGSDLARQPDPAFAEYAAMKAAVLSVSKSLSIEYGPRVRSNVLSPGPTRTPGLVSDFETQLAPAWNLNTEAAIDRYITEIRRMPSARLALPDEIARAAAYLVSPASAPMTGTELVIDGGARKAS
jgi:NAD(P)-dependent dehydrogenase (short-subunit alcohol dehydrogenase family)